MLQKNKGKELKKHLPTRKSIMLQTDTRGKAAVPALERSEIDENLKVWDGLDPIFSIAVKQVLQNRRKKTCLQVSSRSRSKQAKERLCEEGCNNVTLLPYRPWKVRGIDDFKLYHLYIFDCKFRDRYQFPPVLEERTIAKREQRRNYEKTRDSRIHLYRKFSLYHTHSHQ